MFKRLVCQFLSITLITTSYPAFAVNDVASVRAAVKNASDSLETAGFSISGPNGQKLSLSEALDSHSRFVITTGRLGNLNVFLSFELQRRETSVAITSRDAGDNQVLGRTTIGMDSDNYLNSAALIEMAKTDLADQIVASLKAQNKIVAQNSESKSKVDLLMSILFGENAEAGIRCNTAQKTECIIMFVLLIVSVIAVIAGAAILLVDLYKSSVQKGFKKTQIAVIAMSTVALLLSAITMLSQATRNSR